MSRPISVLSHDVIHGICSGQVVVTLASAVKELIENSIDAGATRIEVRLKQLGSESIEVIDNGSGIREAQFESLTGQHCTSKLRVFDDLGSVQTFGFRGEALSALCHLSNLVIHTRAVDATVGSRLEFDSYGKVLARRQLPRAFGTTVTVNNLFHNLPVRRRHLTDPSRLSKEFAKLVNFFTAHCLASAPVQLTCYRIGKKGEKTLVVSNGSASSLKESISAVFGHRQLNTLIEMNELEEIPDYILDEFNCKTKAGSCNIRLTGFVSRPAVGPPPSDSGASSRGCGRSSNDRQFVFVNGRPCELPRVTRLATDVWRRAGREAQTGVSAGVRLPLLSQQTALAGVAGGSFPVIVFLFQVPMSSVDVNVTPDKRTLLLHYENYVLALTKATLLRTFGSDFDGLHVLSLSVTDGANKSASQECTETNERKRPCLDLSLDNGSRVNFSTPLALKSLAKSSCSSLAASPVFTGFTEGVSRSDSSSQLYRLPRLEDLTGTNCGILDLEDLHCKSFTTASFSMADVLASTSVYTKKTEPPTVKPEGVAQPCFESGFQVDSTHPAEPQLTAYFSKANFNRLQVIGQFNLGFIIARHNQDLFIIDQHASDEKYRFERLCETHQFVCQPLVVPQDLHLTVEQEQLLMDNLDVFQRNGFLFHFDEEAPCGKQVRLTATPMFEGKIFGKTDVEEMLFVLNESCSRKCRPSRLRDILASRSCRSAVMIGTALDCGKMKRILENMSTMEHPWNCPHGRPTMRHLFNLNSVAID